MPSITQLLTLDHALSAAITRAEQHTSRAPLPRHVPRKHAALVEAPHAVKTALSRFLVWHSYLRSRKPTKASLSRAAHRARGQLLWRMALLAQQQGILAQRDIPAFALQPPLGSVTRADESNQDNGDPSSWWDEHWQEVYGDVDAATLYAIYNEVRTNLSAAEKQQILADMGSYLSFDEWLAGGLDGDLHVLQLLDTYWSTQTINFAGADFLDAAGIAGDFDIIDPVMMEYLLNYSSQLVTSVNAQTQRYIAQQLWQGLGGAGGEPMAMDALARFLNGQVDLRWYDATKTAEEMAAIAKRRAMMIAVTETARAESMGNFIAMLQSGVQQIIWVVTEGACAICLTNAENGAISIGGEFPSGHRSPPAHPLCRCAATAYIDPTAGFDPTQWVYTPDPSLIASFLGSPDIGRWPEVATPFQRIAIPVLMRGAIQPIQGYALVAQYGAAVDAVLMETHVHEPKLALPPKAVEALLADFDGRQLARLDAQIRAMLTKVQDTTGDSIKL